MNQIELHPFVGPVQAQLAYCRDQGVRVQAHTALARAQHLDFPPLARIAARHGVSPAMVLLRWAHQLGAQLVFSTSSDAHLREVLEGVLSMSPGLSQGDMAELNGFHTARARRFIHPPPITKTHPELADVTDTERYVAAVVRLLREDLAALRDGRPISETARCLHTRTNHELLTDPVAHRIARELFPLEPGQRPMSSHQRYRDAVRALRAALHAEEKRAPKKKRGRCSVAADHPSRAPLPHVAGAPVHVAIAEPKAMPVEIAPAEELRPFFAFVADPARFFDGDAARLAEASAVTFTRGTFFADARMDLCKQVVGPDHIGALVDAVLAGGARPRDADFRVRHFLLGNNVACQGPSTAGAESIARLMRAPELDIETYYLAGNCVGPDDAAVLAEALAEDRSAKALWLKRNPIGAEGARHLGRMLGRSAALELLDLHNCGLLDAGVEALCDGVAAGGELRLRDLYLSANALTARSVAALRGLTPADGASTLRSLHLSINRLGEAGLAPTVAWIASGALAGLRRLDLGSNGLTRPSLRPLVDALIDGCPELVSLDLGTYKSTRDLGETANTLDPDVGELVRLLETHPTLELLDVSICGLPERSVARLVEALGPRQSLEGVGVRGHHHDHDARRVLKHAARVRHIDSIYRGKG